MARHRRLATQVALPLVLLAALAAPAAVSADSPATTPSGFRDREVWTGLTDPTSVAFRPDGSVFVALKDGRIMGFDSLSDPTPTLVADLRADTYNPWDRGLLGLAADPDPSRSFLYALYT